MSRDNPLGRRKFLQLSGVAGAGFLTSGIAAAGGSSGGDGVSSHLAVENGRVTIDGKVSANARGPGPSLPEIVQSMNEGVKKGLWKAVENKNKVSVELTDAGKAEVKRLLREHGLSEYAENFGQRRRRHGSGPSVDPMSVSVQGCGVTKKTSNGVWLNHDDTGKVADAIDDVGSVTALVGVLGGIVLGFPLGLIPAIIFGAASYLFKDFAGDLLRIDEGCGVIVKDYKFVSWDVRAHD